MVDTDLVTIVIADSLFNFSTIVLYNTMYYSFSVYLYLFVTYSTVFTTLFAEGQVQFFCCI